MATGREVALEGYLRTEDSKLYKLPIVEGVTKDKNFSLIKDLVHIPKDPVYFIQNNYRPQQPTLANRDGTGSYYDDDEREIPETPRQTPAVKDAMKDFHLALNTGDTATDVVAGAIHVPRQPSSDSEGDVYYAKHSSAKDLFPITFPLSASDASALKEKLVTSKVGVEGKGDVLDSAIRKSRECALSPEEEGCAVKLPFQVLSFDFPEARGRIREAFCGQSDYDIVYKPYKFVLYAKGDFFMPHADSMSDPRQIGSLAVQVPIGEPQPVSETRSDAKYVGDGPVSTVFPCDYYGVQVEPASDDDDVVTHPGNKSNHSGHIVFYLGRQLGKKRFRNSDIDDEIAYGFPQQTDAENKLVVDLTTHLPQSSPELATSSYAVKYAAWLGDVVHEVTRVTTEYRAVVLFRLYRVKRPNVAKPNSVADVNALLGPLATKYLKSFSDFSEADSTEVDAPNTFGRMLTVKGLSEADVRTRRIGAALDTIMSHIENGTANGAKFLGVMLRHAYPPAGLVREGLKGGDAALFAIADRKFTVTLHTVHDFRTQIADNTFIMEYAYHEGDGMFNPIVYITSDRVVDVDFDDDWVDFDDDCRTRLMYRMYPSFTRDSLWAQQGFGEYTGGGYVLGNCDCGGEWWYRSACMIIQPFPSKMKRRMPLFLLGLRGPETFRRLMNHPDVFTHIMSFV